MTYHAKEPKFLWILLFVMTLTYTYALDSAFEYIAYVVLFLFFAAMTTNYKLEILEDSLKYEIRILSMAISKRVVKPNEIEKVHMIHAGSRPIVLVHLKKGMRLKLHRFVPEGFDESLAQFAHKHAILIDRTGNK